MLETTAGSETVDNPERVVEVAEIDPRIRHTVIFQLCEHLAPGKSLQLVVDHDPRRLRFQLEARHGASFHSAYLEEGPELWRVRIHRLPAASINRT